MLGHLSLRSVVDRLGAIALFDNPGPGADDIAWCRVALRSAKNGSGTALRKSDTLPRSPRGRNVHSRQRRIGGPIDDGSIDREPGPVTRAIPGLFVGIPTHQATKVRADRGADVCASLGIAIDGGFGQTLP